jgi:hypothetical protein
MARRDSAPTDVSRGDVLLARHVFRGIVWSAFPVRAIGETALGLAVWAAPGTAGKRLRASDGRVVRPPERWEVADHVWYGHGGVALFPPGAPFAIRLFWREDGAFEGWYIDLQEPVRIEAGRIDTMDHALDIWIAPGAAPVLKDDDHLDQHVALGIRSEAEAGRIRATAAEFLSRRSRYLPTGLEAFTPDPSWPVPVLPPDWAAW